MTMCNMSIEWGAKAGMVAPDDTTFAYLEAAARAARCGMGRPRSSTGARSRRIRSEFEREIVIDAAKWSRT